MHQEIQCAIVLKFRLLPCWYSVFVLILKWSLWAFLHSFIFIFIQTNMSEGWGGSGPCRLSIICSTEKSKASMKPSSLSDESIIMLSDALIGRPLHRQHCWSSRGVSPCGVDIWHEEARCAGRTGASIRRVCTSCRRHWVRFKHHPICSVSRWE